METVVVTGSPSSGGYTNFRSLFSETEQSINVMSNTTTEGYFNDMESPDSWETFLDFDDYIEFLDTLQSGNVKIVETYDTDTEQFVYLALPDNVSESSFTLSDAIFGIQIAEEEE